jgi:HEPN domain-containing protein
MSTEKCVEESKRWLVTAEDDLDSAVILGKNGKFAHSCFHAQQAAEKALKAAWYLSDADPWGHSVKKLIEDLENINGSFYDVLRSFIRIGMVLDRFYIPTRYPNGLPEITPDAAFTAQDADTCIAHATEIVRAVRSLV